MGGTILATHVPFELSKRSTDNNQSGAAIVPRPRDAYSLAAMTNLLESRTQQDR